jgi:WD40 repeat protein
MNNDDQSIIPMVACDLGLDINVEVGIDDENMKYRRLLKIPTTKEILAYGGSDCSINKIVADNTSAKPTTATVRRWDDEFVKAVAISFDGKRIVVGNDVCEVHVFHFNDDSNTSSINANDVHPFCRSDSKLGDLVLGATFDAPIRDLQFYPNSSDWIAVATEGGMGLICITDLSNTATRYLWDLAAEHHNSGIRSLSFHHLSNAQVCLASLSMDGRLCLWDVSDLKNPQDWKLLVRESTKCIPKNDVGDILGADPWDQSCRPMFLTVPSNTKKSNRISVLALPGMPYLQLRRLDINDAQIKLESCDQPNMNDTAIQGHIEPIATLATCPNSSYLISGGRDNRVVLWSIQQRQVSSLVSHIPMRAHDLYLHLSFFKRLMGLSKPNIFDS